MAPAVGGSNPLRYPSIMRVWRNGIRDGLKTHCPKGLEGSIPSTRIEAEVTKLVNVPDSGSGGKFKSLGV